MPTYLNSFNAQYHHLLHRVMEHGIEEVNERTGARSKALPHMVLSSPIQRHIEVVGARRVFPKSAAAELAWCLSGDKNIEWLQQHTPMWNQFTNEHNEIDCAYGWRWQTAFNRDQLQMAIDALKKDTTDRQIVVMAWDPRVDGLGNRWSKNVPCPIGFMVNIIDNKLNLTMLMRSSDVVVGLVYDSIFYELLLVALANELGVGYGMFTAFLNHAHIYKSHWGIAEQMIRNLDDYLCTGIPKQDMYIPQDFLISGLIEAWGITEIKKDPDSYVDYIKSLTTKPKSSPKAMLVKPEVIE